MLTEILKLIFFLALIAGINEHFDAQQNKRKFKNLYPEIEKYDSIAIYRIDSLLTVYK